MKLPTMLMAVLMIAACADAKQPWESAPVTVDTDQGPVTCQLYTDKAVLWDRATARPAGMTDDTANRVCRAEGEMRRGGSTQKLAAEAL
ncbi:hypothetical protein [Paracoccus aminovorans]|uniref:hypothetical protein n=1 Tax=Paracoccus aminovorans TaxID=34004 RepID=UPI002B2590B0|nr:hypothetical protein [Paracoccus aminovorans]